MMRLRRGKSRPRALPAHRHLGHDGAALPQDRVDQGGVARRVDPVLAAGHHRHGAGLQAGLVGPGVDAAREAGNHRQARLAEAAGQPIREGETRRGGVARAHEGHGRTVQDRGAAQGQERGRRVGLLEQARVLRLAGGDQLSAEPGQGRHLVLGLRAGHGLQPLALSAGEVGKGIEGGAGAGESVDERAEGARPRRLRCGSGAASRDAGHR